MESAPPIERVVFTEEQIAERIRAVASEISTRYQPRGVRLIGVLKGSVFFLTALAREITVPVKIDFLSISSYGARPGDPGMVRIEKDLDEPIEGEDVLLIEDIVDTGFTARYLLKNLQGRGPKSLAICTLLDRSIRRIAKVPIEFRCFELDDFFVAGFGLDYQQLYRNRKDIVVIEQGASPQTRDRAAI